MLRLITRGWPHLLRTEEEQRSGKRPADFLQVVAKARKWPTSEYQVAQLTGLYGLFSGDEVITHIDDAHLRVWHQQHRTFS